MKLIMFVAHAIARFILRDWKKRSVKVAAISGFFIHSAVTSLIQDFMGKERYLEMASEAWMSWKVTVPIALVFFVFSVLALLVARDSLKIVEDTFRAQRSPHPQEETELH